MSGLRNKTIGITRQENQAQELIRAIENAGGKALLLPTIATCPTDKSTERDRALSALSSFDWLVFSSENAVKYFWASLPQAARRRGFPKVAAVGSKTAKALRQVGVHVDVIPAKYTARGLLEVFGKLGVTNQRFLLPVSNIARSELPDGLQALGARVFVVEFYKTIPNPRFNNEYFQRLLQQDALDVLTFFSPSAFEFLLRLAGKDLPEILKQNALPLAAIGPTTTSAIERYGLKVAIQPEKSDSQHLLQALQRYFAESEPGMSPKRKNEHEKRK